MTIAVLTLHFKSDHSFPRNFASFETSHNDTEICDTTLTTRENLHCNFFSIFSAVIFANLYRKRVLANNVGHYRAAYRKALVVCYQVVENLLFVCRKRKTCKLQEWFCVQAFLQLMPYYLRPAFFLPYKCKVYVVCISRSRTNCPLYKPFMFDNRLEIIKYRLPRKSQTDQANNSF